MKKFISVFICLMLIASLFAGCSGGEERIDLIYPFSGKINSYDPQVASTADEYMLAENCFEGLVRCDDEGNITPGCASSWEIEDGGASYTFHLQKGLKWYVYKKTLEKYGDDFSPEITAHDFVFALRRAVSPETNSPLYSTISSIEGAPQIHAGHRNVDSLGVYAIDDYTLRINLSAPDAGFLQALSTAAAMPCNEKFFNETNGRYGLSTDYTMFNGQFMLGVITESAYILKKNEKYAGPSAAIAADVTFKIVDPDEAISPQLISGYYDAAYIRGYESVYAGKKKGVSLSPYSNITWAFVFNENSGMLEYKNARKALSIALSTLDYEKYPYLSEAKGIIPPTCTANGKSYTEQASDVTYSLNHDEAIKLWKSAASGASVYSAELTVIAPESMESIAKELIQGIQKSICTISNIDGKKASYTIKLETMPESELKARAYSGEYDIALYPFEATTSSPVSFLQGFSDVNSSGFDAAGFNLALSRAHSASAQELVSACETAERELVNSFCYAPLFYESSYYAMAKGVSNVVFHPGTGRVSFIYATRKD